MTDSQPILKTSLLDVLYELRDQKMPLILGGGYGLYLKQVHLQDTLDSPTLIAGELWPDPRATEDLDILLRTEVVVDASRMGLIRSALDRLEYTAIDGAEYMQFDKHLGGGRIVKVDLLTGPLGLFANDPRVKVDDRRVRPRPSVKLHAHRTDEALGFQEHTMAIPVTGTLSGGDPYEATVHVPSAFTLLLMKLHAFRDLCNDEEKDLARHHALDIYRIVAMMTEQEFEQTRQQVAEHQDHPAVLESVQIVREYFASDESLGSLRLRGHALWNERMALTKFLSALKDLFGPTG
ncbi:MAG: nucleotidyl transferase AbiEii/AbiGii toxin family protein [Phycisphaerae bacterium]|nr:nucleotidyl transferase AbiEii/AbiGii toxin family protein [Phycisphaerae bacterium]